MGGAYTLRPINAIMEHARASGDPTNPSPNTKIKRYPSKIYRKPHRAPSVSDRPVTHRSLPSHFGQHYTRTLIPEATSVVTISGNEMPCASK